MAYKEFLEFLKRLEHLRVLHETYHKHESEYVVCSCGKQILPEDVVNEENILYIYEAHKDLITKNDIIRYLLKRGFKIESNFLKKLSPSDIFYIYKDIITLSEFFNLCHYVSKEYINMFYKRFEISKIKSLIEYCFEFFEDKETFLRNYYISNYLDQVIIGCPFELISLIRYSEEKFEIDIRFYNTKEKVLKLYEFIKHVKKIPETGIVVRSYKTENFKMLLDNKLYGFAFLVNRYVTLNYLFHKYNKPPSQIQDVAHEVDRIILKSIKVEKADTIENLYSYIGYQSEIYYITFKPIYEDDQKS